MAKILVIEDERDLSGLIGNWLLREHHLVEVAYEGDTAIALMLTNKYDVIILDLMLPGIGGVEICRRYRRQQGRTPILMITAKDSVDDKEAGLDSGADDYLTKPFHLKELAARVRALLRRGVSSFDSYITIHNIVIDTGEHRVTKDGVEVHLLPKEFRLLEFLARHPHHVFSAVDLLSSVWESDTSALLDTVRGHIQRLRKKLDTPGRPSIIATVYGLGYKIDMAD